MGYGTYEDIFISDKVLGTGRKDQRADGVKDSSCPYRLLWTSETNSKRIAGEPQRERRGYAEEYHVNAEIRRSGTILSGRRTPNLDRSYCQDEVCPFVGKSGSFQTSPEKEKPLRSKANIEFGKNGASNTSITSNAE